MSRILLCITMPLLVLILLTTPALANKPLKVVCTLPDIGWLAEQVGGDAIEVSVLCPGEYDPHFLPARPSLARRLSKADLLCYNGLDLEVGWLPVLLEKARNNRVRPGQSGDLDCSHALKNILEVPEGEVSRSQGDVHPEGNPHYLLDPRNGLLVAELIATRLSELRPESAGVFQKRVTALSADLNQRIVVWSAQAAPLKGRPLIKYTKQWEYLAMWLGLNFMGAVEHRPGISPSPRHVDEVIAIAKAKNIHELIAAPWNHLDIASKAADRMGAKLVILPAAVESIDEVPTYPVMFDVILARLLAATEE